MKVIISGYGRMGHMVEKELQRRGIEIALASEDITAVDPALAKDCVCIDFTWPDSFRKNYPFIAKHFKAAVVGTTGWSDILPEVRKAFEDAGTPLIYASNFSLGVNALYAAVTRAAGMLKGAGYTPAIEETHHIHKLDAPSGTAKVLGSLVEESLGEKPKIDTDNVGDPSVNDFSQWFLKATDSGMPYDADTIFSNSKINGEWKAIFMYSETGVNELSKVNIEAGDHAVTVTVKHKYVSVNGGDYMNDSTPDTSFDGAADNGSLTAYSNSGKLEIWFFWEYEGKQYGLGTFTNPSGEKASVGLMRP